MQITYTFTAQKMSFGKGALLVNEKPFDQKPIAKFPKCALRRKIFGCEQVKIEVTEELYAKFIEEANHCLLVKRYLLVIFFGE